MSCHDNIFLCFFVDEHPAAMQQKETTSSTGKNKVVGGGGAVKFEVMWGWVGLVMGGMLVLYM